MAALIRRRIWVAGFPLPVVQVTSAMEANHARGTDISCKRSRSPNDADRPPRRVLATGASGRGQLGPMAWLLGKPAKIRTRRVGNRPISWLRVVANRWVPASDCAATISSRCRRRAWRRGNAMNLDSTPGWRSSAPTGGSLRTLDDPRIVDVTTIRGNGDVGNLLD